MGELSSEMAVKILNLFMCIFQNKLLVLIVSYENNCFGNFHWICLNVWFVFFYKSLFISASMLISVVE